MEFRVAPVSIDQIWPGQPVGIRFSAFNQRTTPELLGKIGLISPATVVDEATGMAYYRVTAIVGENELSRRGTLELMPGMPVEGYIGEQERSIMSYLTKPIIEQFERAFREE